MISTQYVGVFYRIKVSKATGKEEKIFYIKYYDPNKKRRMEVVGSSSKGCSAAQANRMRSLRIEGKELPNEVKRKNQKEKQAKEANKWTLDRIWQDYKADKEVLKGLQTDDSRFKKYINPEFGKLEPSEIDQFAIRKLRKKLEKSLKPQTVKHILALIRRIINHGIKLDYCKPLTFKIEMPTVNNSKTEDLTSEQLATLLDKIEKEKNIQVKNFMKMVLYTGMRRGELFRLKWGDINFEKNFITIRDPKGGVDQKIPLNQSAKEILSNHERPFPESPYVFPGKAGNQRTEIKKPVNRIKKAAKLPKDFRPLHGLRHVFASMLASSGQVDMYTLQKLLTHKTPQMTQRYAHLRDDTLKNASNLVTNLIKKEIDSDETNDETG